MRYIPCFLVLLTFPWGARWRSAGAEVDHPAQGGAAVGEVAPVVDETDLAAETPELRVRQAELDGGDDPVDRGPQERRTKRGLTSTFERGRGWDRTIDLRIMSPLL